MRGWNISDGAQNIDQLSDADIVSIWKILPLTGSTHCVILTFAERYRLVVSLSENKSLSAFIIWSEVEITTQQTA